MVFPAVLMLALNGRKLCPPDQECPEKSDAAENQVWFDYSQCFGPQVRFISTGTLTNCDLCRRKFHAGENEGSAYQSTRDGAKRVEGLGKVEALFRSVGIAKLGDERVRCGLEKRQTAGNHKERAEKVSVLPHVGS